MLVLFHCQRSFSEVRIHELFAKLEDGFDSYGASAPNPQSMTVGGASSSMPVVAAGCLLAAPPPPPPATARSPGLIHGLFGEDDETDNILGDSGPFSSSSAQQPPHFSTLNVEAIGQHLDIDPTSGRQGLHKENLSVDFQIGQSFQTKEEAVLSVKDYSIRHGFQYWVIESDHLKFHGRCKKFGNWCTWLIHITHRQRKGTWEVRRYNGPHTCLATSISSDHRQLDHHVICAKIFPLARADAAVMTKVLQKAKEATYGFRPSYRKV
ncbi:uncharacterized protein LOC107462298 [Arachis duranensis]|uniref:Uncharacterized protein LOC107462298 n=1 Tax=Arachis duranensis TaxID=130453 RepID=A0A6P4BEG1_ARADU|nr:uncharacterized protein LOC107462298 [Arachis duranensis]